MQRILEELGLNRLQRPTGHAELEKLDAQRSALTSRRSHWRLGCLTCGGGSCGRASLSMHIWLAALAYVVRLAVGSVVRTVAPSLSSVSAVIGAPLVQVAVAGALVALTAVTHVASALQRHGAIESQCYAMGQTVATAAITAAAWMPASPLPLPRREAGGGGAAAAVATPDDDDRRGYARRIVRFLNAAHVAAFISLSDSLSAENLLTEMDDRFSLLTRAESDAVARLADRAPVGASGGFDLCTLWAMQQVDRARQSGALTSAQAQRLHSHAETLHALRGSLAALVTRPLPLGMRHFVLWTQALFLPLFGAAVARECEGDPLSWPFGFLGVVLVALAFALLRVLAENMSHPIGISDADLPVLRMCTTIALATQEMLEGFDEADSSSERETDQAGGATLEMAAPQFGIAGGAEARAAMRPLSPGEFEPFVFDSGDESRKAAMRSRSASPIGKGRQFKNRGRTISGEDLFTPEGTCAHARAAKAAVLGSVRIDPGQSRRLSRTLSRRLSMLKQVRRRSSFGATASVFPERAFLSVVAAPAAASRVATSPTESPPESPPESSPGSPPPSTAAAMEGPANAEPSFTEVEALLTSFYRCVSLLSLSTLSFLFLHSAIPLTHTHTHTHTHTQHTTHTHAFLHRNTQTSRTEQSVASEYNHNACSRINASVSFACYCGRKVCMRFISYDG